MIRFPLPNLSKAASRQSVIGMIVLAALWSGATAQANNTVLSTWRSLYPSSQSEDNAAGAGLVCVLCHQSQSPRNWNAYGWSIRQGVQAGMSYTNAILAVESFDADLDPTGSSNLIEINADTQPGYTDGPNNTWYFADGTTSTNQNPPSGILGTLDPVASPWNDLGHGLAGTGGAVPLLVGSGSLQPGTSAVLTLSNALPNSQAWLFIGLSQINVPFKGGTLVPSNDLLIPGLPLSNSGGLVLGTNWPALPSGTGVYFQYWVVDPGGPFGASASNAVVGVTP